MICLAFSMVVLIQMCLSVHFWLETSRVVGYELAFFFFDKNEDLCLGVMVVLL